MHGQPKCIRKPAAVGEKENSNDQACKHIRESRRRS